MEYIQISNLFDYEEEMNTENDSGSDDDESYDSQYDADLPRMTIERANFDLGQDSRDFLTHLTMIIDKKIEDRVKKIIDAIYDTNSKLFFI